MEPRYYKRQFGVEGHINLCITAPAVRATAALCIVGSSQLATSCWPSQRTRRDCKDSSDRFNANLSHTRTPSHIP